MYQSEYIQCVCDMGVENWINGWEKSNLLPIVAHTLPKLSSAMVMTIIEQLRWTYADLLVLQLASLGNESVLRI